MDRDRLLDEVARIAARHEGLRLLVLHGSRGRGDHHDRSDWDFGYLADTGFEASGLLADLMQALGDDVDLVDLARASALLRFRAARDGRPVHERGQGTFEAFALDATLFWCDAEPVIRRAQAGVLARLSR